MSHFELLQTVIDLYRGTAKHKGMSRPLSFVLSPLFIWSRLSANQITMMNVGLLVCILALLAQGTPGTLYAGVAGFFLFTVIDYVDGNVSRYRGSGMGSYRGGSIRVPVAVGEGTCYIKIPGGP